MRGQHPDKRTFHDFMGNKAFPRTVFKYEREDDGVAFFSVFHGSVFVNHFIEMPLDVYDGMNRPSYISGREYIDFAKKKNTG